MVGHTAASPSRLGVLFLAVLSAVVQPSNSEESEQEYCSEGARLSSKFLVPFYESHLNVSRDELCASAPKITFTN